MNLEFRLLLVDDNPDAIEQALKSLEDYLFDKGFNLSCAVANDRTPQGLRKLARQNGKDFDLVVIDYNLGGGEASGSSAVEQMRRELQYTDIIFYSSDPSVNLWYELAEKRVMGVFIADRVRIGEVLTGIADTIIGKAVDLNHMRGIAMAEVAEMDLLMEDTLHFVFDCDDLDFRQAARETLEKLVASAEERVKYLRPIVERDDIRFVIGNSLAFSSSDKYKAIRRAAKKVAKCPAAALDFLKTYEADIIKNRNVLAHAKEERDRDGRVALRSSKRGEAPISIDEGWMAEFRGKLREHRVALIAVCAALTEHVTAIEAQQAQQG